MYKQTNDVWALPFGKPVFGQTEADYVQRALAHGHIATGVLCAQFERRFEEKIGVTHAISCCSGSTANLLAVSALLAAGRIRPGDRMLVSGATFITAISPVLQCGLIPVFVDVEAGGLNIDLDLAERAIGEIGATAMLVPHTLGQVIASERLLSLKARTGVAMIEDCCETLVSSVGGGSIGSVGDFATFSFYAGHHMTMGEGGILTSGSSELQRIAKSLRVFGRDIDYSGERFAYDVGDRPIAPDERYIHTMLGYNAKLTDIQAAFGFGQLDRIDDLQAKRRVLAGRLVEMLTQIDGLDVLGDPVAPGNSPFGIAFTCPSREDRNALARILHNNGVEVRGILGASTAHQPCFDTVEKIIFNPYDHARALGLRGLLIGCPPEVDADRALAALKQSLGQWQSRLVQESQS